MYEAEAYARELRATHYKEEHAGEEVDGCPVCEDHDSLPEGFSSDEEYSEALREGAAELEDELEAHLRGEHKTSSANGCIECARKEGEKI